MAGNQQQNTSNTINSSNLLSPSSGETAGNGSQSQQRRKSTLSAHNFFIDYSRRRSSAAVRERLGGGALSPVRAGAASSDRNSRHRLSCFSPAQQQQQTPQFELTTVSALQLMAPVALAGSRKTSIFDPPGHSLLQRHGSQQIQLHGIQAGGATETARRKATLVVSPADSTMLAVAKNHAERAKQRAGLGGKVTGAQQHRTSIQHVPVIGCSPTSIGASLAALDDSRKYERLLRKLRRHLERKEHRRRMRERKYEHHQRDSSLAAGTSSKISASIDQSNLERRRKSLQQTIRAALAKGKRRNCTKSDIITASGSFSSAEESEDETCWDAESEEDDDDNSTDDRLSVSSMSLDSPVSRASLASLDRFLEGEANDQTRHSESAVNRPQRSQSKGSLVSAALRRLTGGKESRKRQHREGNSRLDTGGGPTEDYWYYYYYLRENSLDPSQTGGGSLGAGLDEQQAGGGTSLGIALGGSSTREAERRARLHINYSLARLQILNDSSSAPRSKLAEGGLVTSDELLSQSTDYSLALSTSSSFSSSSSGPSTRSSCSSNCDNETRNETPINVQNPPVVRPFTEMSTWSIGSDIKNNNNNCCEYNFESRNNQYQGNSYSSNRLCPSDAAISGDPRRERHRVRSTSGELISDNEEVESQLMMRRSHNNLLATSEQLRGSQRSIGFTGYHKATSMLITSQHEKEEPEEELDDFERLRRAHRGYVPPSEPKQTQKARDSSLRLSVRSSRSSGGSMRRRRQNAAGSSARASRSIAVDKQRAISMSWDTLNNLSIDDDHSVSNQQLNKSERNAAVKATAMQQLKAAFYGKEKQKRQEKVVGSFDSRTRARSMAKLSSQIELASLGSKLTDVSGRTVRRCTSASLRVPRNALSNNNNNNTSSQRTIEPARQLVNLNSDPSLLSWRERNCQVQNGRQFARTGMGIGMRMRMGKGMGTGTGKEKGNGKEVAVGSTASSIRSNEPATVTAASGCSSGSGLDVQLRARAHSAGTRAAGEVALRESRAIARQLKLQQQANQLQFTSNSMTLINNSNSNDSNSSSLPPPPRHTSDNSINTNNANENESAQSSKHKEEEQVLLKKKKSILKKNSFTCLLLGARQSGKRTIVKCFVKLLNEFKLAAAEYRREKLLAKLAVCSEQLQEILEQRKRQQEQESNSVSRRRSRVNSWLASGPVHRLLANVSSSGADVHKRQQLQHQRLSCSINLNLPINCQQENQSSYQRRHTSVGRSDDQEAADALLHATRVDQQEDWRFLRVHNGLSSCNNKSDSNINYHLDDQSSHTHQLQLQVPELNSRQVGLNSTASSSRSSICAPSQRHQQQQQQQQQQRLGRSKSKTRRRIRNLRELLTLKELHRRRLKVKFSTRRQISDRLLDQMLLPNQATYKQLEVPDAFVLVYAVNDRNSFEYAKSMLIQLRSIKKHNENALIVLVANKIDLERAKKVRTEDLTSINMGRLEGRTLARKNGCKFIEISCTVGFNLDNLLVGLRTQLILRHHSILNSIFRPTAQTGNENSNKHEQTVSEQKKGGSNILVRFYKRYVTDNYELDYDCDNFSKL